MTTSQVKRLKQIEKELIVKRNLLSRTRKEIAGLILERLSLQLIDK